MLDVDHNRWRNPERLNFEEQTETVKKMKEVWGPFDWTERAKNAIQNNASDSE